MATGSADRPRAVIVGARRQRQGIGEFIAANLDGAGVEIAGIVGTTDETVAEAQRGLEQGHGIRARGYLSLAEALAKERPTLVAICSPYAHHRAQLERVARAGAHCLCEKPLWWWTGAGEPGCPAVTATLANDFARQGLLLDLVTQWPYTLAAFDELHEGVRGGETLHRFEMILSPLSRGGAMLPDAAPHVLSMLHALVGAGVVQDPVAAYDDPDGERMALDFRYRHAAGETAVSCRFNCTPARPRPAAYAINGRWVHRRIGMPGYAIHFDSDDASIAVEDPLKLLVRDFVSRLRCHEPTDVRRLVAGMSALEQLATAVARAGAPKEG